jgi:4-coumarate--CoA ligase
LDQPFMDKVALIDGFTGESWTYAELKRRICTVASGLADLGVKQGDMVMLLSPNSLHFPVLLHAVAVIGAVVTATNPANLSAEIAKQVKDSQTKFIATSPEFIELVADFRLPLILIDTSVEESEIKKAKNVMGKEPFAYLSDLYRADPSRAPKVRIKQSDTAVVLYSSGTTGLSKGVIISHRNLIAAIVTFADPSFGLPHKGFVFLVPIPMYHVYSLVCFCAALFKRAYTAVIMPKFDFPKFLELIPRYRVTHLALVPPMGVGMWKSPLLDKFDMSSLYAIGFGGAPSGEDLLKGLSKRLKGVHVGQVPLSLLFS